MYAERIATGHTGVELAGIAQGDLARGVIDSEGVASVAGLDGVVHWIVARGSDSAQYRAVIIALFNAKDLAGGDGRGDIVDGNGDVLSSRVVAAFTVIGLDSKGVACGGFIVECVRIR